MRFSVVTCRAQYRVSTTATHTLLQISSVTPNINLLICRRVSHLWFKLYFKSDNYKIPLSLCIYHISSADNNDLFQQFSVLNNYMFLIIRILGEKANGKALGEILVRK